MILVLSERVESGREIVEKMKLKSNMAELQEKCTAEIGREAAELIKKAANPQ